MGIEEGGCTGTLFNLVPESLNEIVDTINGVLVLCSQMMGLETRSATRRKGRSPDSSLKR